jgi:pimeloyl-ACP methyl ester carboxylesterase
MKEKILSLPRMGETMEEGTVLTWLKSAGDSFRRGEVLLELETDKMVVEVPALEDGSLLEILAPEESKVEIGTALARVLGVEDSGTEPPGAALSPETTSLAPDANPSVDSRGMASVTLQTAVPISKTAMTPDAAAEVAEPTQGRFRASPAARRLAQRHDISLAAAAGTGPLGRITRADIEQLIDSANSARNLPALESVAPESSVSEHWCELGSLRIRYIRKGVPEQTPLLFIHGFGSDRHTWRYNLGVLSKHREVWALDLPGHGDSSGIGTLGASQPLGIPEYAEIVAQFLAAQNLARVHLIGHSLGGGVALQLAVRQPQVLASLALLAPIGLGHEINRDFIEGFILATTRAALTGSLHRLFYSGTWVNASLLDSLEEQRRDPGRLGALRKTAQALHDNGVQHWQIREQLSGLPMPVKVIWGREDQVIPSAHAWGLPGEIAVHLFPETGHMAHVEQSVAVNRLLEELVAFE